MRTGDNRQRRKHAHLFPVILERRLGRQVARVVHDLELAENVATRQYIHDCWPSLSLLPIVAVVAPLDGLARNCGSGNRHQQRKLQGGRRVNHPLAHGDDGITESRCTAHVPRRQHNASECRNHEALAAGRRAMRGRARRTAQHSSDSRRPRVQQAAASNGHLFLSLSLSLVISPRPLHC